MPGICATQTQPSFTVDGMFWSKDAEGDTVDDGSDELVDNSTMIITKEFGKIIFHFTANDQTLVLTPVFATVRKGRLLRCPVGGWHVICPAGVEPYGVAAETTCGRREESNQAKSADAEDPATELVARHYVS
jgi:hypothetical protein